MRFLLLLIFSFLLNSAIHSQESKQHNPKEDIDVISIHSDSDKDPLFLVIIDSISYVINNLDDYELKPDWIERVTVLKDDKSKRKYGTEVGVVLIELKKKYRKRVLKEIGDQEYSPID